MLLQATRDLLRAAKPATKSEAVSIHMSVGFHDEHVLLLKQHPPLICWLAVKAVCACAWHAAGSRMA